MSALFNQLDELEGAALRPSGPLSDDDVRLVCKMRRSVARLYLSGEKFETVVRIANAGIEVVLHLGKLDRLWQVYAAVPNLWVEADAVDEVGVAKEWLAWNPKDPIRISQTRPEDFLFHMMVSAWNKECLVRDPVKLRSLILNYKSP